MSQKTKRLAKVIEARERVRDRHAAETAVAEQILQAARSEQAEVERRESAFLGSLEQITGTPINANVLIDLDRQRRLWTVCVEQAERQVELHTVETERRRARLQEAARSLRVSERAHERMTAIEQRERDQREQRFADDLSAGRRPR